MRDPGRQDIDWSGRRVLITGANGFLGSHLCHRLCDAGGEVHATSRQQRSSGLNRPVWWLADMADPAATRRVMAAAKPEIIFHLAGSVGADPSLERVLPTYHSLLTSTVNLLFAATELGCRRVVLTGSLTEPLPDAHNPTPRSPYAAAKWASSAYGRMFHALYRTPVVVLRPFMTYGPAQDPAKLIPSVTLSLLRGEAPKLSSGRVRADWVYISDIIDAFLVAARAPGVEGSTFDLGTGKFVTIRAVVDELVAVIGTDIAPVFGALPDRPAENEITAVTDPAAERLGWRATTSLKDGLRHTVEWYRGVVS